MHPGQGNVVVTGAGGNLGSGVLARLRADGRPTVATVQDDSQRVGVPGPVVAVDLTDFATTVAALRGAESIIHLAAMPSPSAGPPEVVFANNSLSTFHVLQAARALGVRRVVLASSVAAYGLSFATRPQSPLFVPVSEEHELLPSDPYGLSKQVGEVSAATIVRAATEPFTVVALRLHWISTRAQQLAKVARDGANPAAGASELWGYVDREDAIDAVVRSLDVVDAGLHVVNVCAPDTINPTPTAELLREFHPTTVLREALPGHTSPWSSARCAHLLGAAPATSWRHDTA